MTMPYESAAQRGWMHVHEPKIAEKWDKEGGQVKAKKLNSSDGPEALNKEVEKKMKHLAIESKKPESEKFESRFQKEKAGSPYLPEDDDKGDESYEFGVKPVKNMA
jgi:hypothetical protein